MRRLCVHSSGLRSRCRHPVRASVRRSRRRRSWLPATTRARGDRAGRPPPEGGVTPRRCRAGIDLGRGFRRCRAVPVGKAHPDEIAAWPDENPAVRRRPGSHSHTGHEAETPDEWRHRRGRAGSARSVTPRSGPPPRGRPSGRASCLADPGRRRAPPRCARLGGRAELRDLLRQEKPLGDDRASVGAASRTAGRSTRSPQALRDVVVLLLVAERAGHAAAAASRARRRRAPMRLEQLLLGARSRRSPRGGSGRGASAVPSSCGGS